MIIKEYKKEYKDYFMFITVHHSMIEVSVYSYTNDNFKYKQKFIDYSVKVVDNLTNSRIDKWDEVLNYEVIKALNLVAYYKDKQRMEQQVHREQMQRLKRR
jgi:uncharacterized membrane protein